MKKLLSLLSLVLVFGLVQGQEVDFEAVFDEQIEASCKRGGLMKKTVLSHMNGQTESRTFKIACADGAGMLDLSEELEYAFKYNAWNARQKADFDFQTGSNLVTGQPKTEEAEDIPLKLQEVKYNESTGKITYVRSRILDENWFFSLSVEIEVFFDNSGLYEKHILRTGSDSMVSQESFSTEMSGEWTTEPNP